MKKNCIGIVGLGYVGLPLAVEFCRAGFQVIGVDTNEERLKRLCQGSSYIADVASQDIQKFVSSYRLCPTTEFSTLQEAEGISICVPTPLRKTREPDISCVIAAARNISRILQAGQIVVLESTVYPGATESLVAPILEKSGLKAGTDFYLAFSPERIDPGNHSIQLRDIPKLVGGISEQSTCRAVELYQPIFPTIIPMTSAKGAEMAKLLENTFRAVNIGLVNELAVMAHHMDINIWEVIDAAASKPFGFLPFYPGPGWGGHCIPVDPVYLSWRAKMDGLDVEFIDQAVKINNHMPQYIVDRVADLLNEYGKPIRGSRLLLLGVAYKRDVADVRESPALPILAILEQKQAIVTYHDPYLPRLRDNGRTLGSQRLDSELLSSQDCVIITTDHSSFDSKFIVEHSSLVFDTRNATRGLHKQYPHVYLL
jgi:UDP-N-acetyl-D-glucosamine dehydrogenase